MDETAHHLIDLAHREELNLLPAGSIIWDAHDIVWQHQLEVIPGRDAFDCPSSWVPAVWPYVFKAIYAAGPSLPVIVLRN